MEERIEIAKAKNGYQIKVWGKQKEDAKDSEVMYHEPDMYVAENEEELMKIVKENL